MSEIGFYHLQRTGLDRALPKLLEKALERGLRVVVRAGSDERVDALNAALWVHEPDSFLPHGAKADGFSSEQPIYLTADPAENPNGARVLVLVDGIAAADVASFERVLDLFDGNDQDAVEAARVRWRALQTGGHVLTYWQQTESGGWERKGT